MPPRRPGWDRRQTADACVRWAISLVEALVSLRRLIQLDESLAEAADADPELVALVFAGVTADVVRTLPSDDAWRTVVLLPSAEAPTGAQDADQHPMSGLQTPPGGAGAPPEGLRHLEERSGASEGEHTTDPSRRHSPSPPPVWPSGAVFGTWRDGIDLVELAWGSPDRDPAFVPLADDLAPGAGRVLVAAMLGWRAAWSEALLVLGAGRPTGAGPGDAVPPRGAVGERPGEAPDPPHRALTDALRWACWRRRSYGIAPAEDVWPYEAAHHWASRGFALLEQGIAPDEATIERDISFHRIAEP